MFLGFCCLLRETTTFALHFAFSINDSHGKVSGGHKCVWEFWAVIVLGYLWANILDYLGHHEGHIGHSLLFHCYFFATVNGERGVLGLFLQDHSFWASHCWVAVYILSYSPVCVSPNTTAHRVEQETMDNLTTLQSSCSDLCF